MVLWKTDSDDWVEGGFGLALHFAVVQKSPEGGVWFHSDRSREEGQSTMGNKTGELVFEVHSGLASFTPMYSELICDGVRYEQHGCRN